jgi:hypothetical protein
VTLPELADAALAFANTLRAQDGRYVMPALVVGAPCDCARCPVANTANVGVKPSSPRWEIGGVAVKMSRTGKPTRGKATVAVPPSVSEFMCAFDAGEFPELLAESRETVAA